MADEPIADIDSFLSHSRPTMRQDSRKTRIDIQSAIFLIPCPDSPGDLTSPSVFLCPAVFLKMTVPDFGHAETLEWFGINISNREIGTAPGCSDDSHQHAAILRNSHPPLPARLAGQPCLGRLIGVLAGNPVCQKRDPFPFFLTEED
jgi:hypothetical protein